MASKETPAAVEYEKLKKASTDALQKKLLKHIELDKEQIMAAAREKLYSWILIKKSLATGTLPILERFREKSQPEEKPAAASATSDMQILFQQNQMFLQQILKEAEDRRIAMEKEAERREKEAERKEKEAEVRQSLLLKEAEERKKEAEVRQSLLLKEAEERRIAIEKEADERIKMMRTWFEIKDEAAIRERNMREEKEKVVKEEAEKLRAEENEKRIQREEEENARRMQREREILEEENKKREAAEIEHRRISRKFIARTA